MTPDQTTAGTADITLYFAPASRSFTPLWLLEELGIPFRLKRLTLGRGDHKTPAFLRVNPMGKVPALRDGDIHVSENPAICLYLADRYSYGTLAPERDHPARGPYLTWMVFSTAVFEPSTYRDEPQDAESSSGRGWGSRASVVDTIDQALQRGPWLLGDAFSAADVMLGSLLSVALFNHRIEAPPPSFIAYNKQLEARGAYQRAAATTWGGTA